MKPPFDPDGDYLGLLMRVMQGEILPPEQRNPQRAHKIPPELSAIAMKALAKNPKDRYSDVEALRKDVERFQEGRSVSAKEDTRREILVKFFKRNKGFTAGLALAFMVLLGSLWFLMQAWLDSGRAYTELQSRTQQAVPALLRAAKLSIREREFEDALKQTELAVTYAPDNADARLLLAKLRIVEQDYAQAQEELEEFRRLRPHDARGTASLHACQQAKRDDIQTLMGFAKLFTEENSYGLADGMMQAFGSNAVQANRKLQTLYRQRIEKAWPGLGRRLFMTADGKFSFSNNANPVPDLTPLIGIPLTSLTIQRSDQLRDLAPLEGMPLTSLDLRDCNQVRDLTPLRGMRLTKLNLSGCTQVQDLSVLRGMPLTYLDLTNCRQVEDVTLLKGMPLTYLSLSYCRQFQDLTLLEGMPLTFLNLNSCSQIQDLTPLKGMSLTSLNLTSCSKVGELTPLRGMPLTSLNLASCSQVEDLTSLIGMRLSYLSLFNCSRVDDLSPLQGMPLTSLNLSSCRRLRHLTPLRGMPLTTLFLDGCDLVRDLTPLAGAKLEYLLLTPKNVTQGIEVLQSMSSLRTIGVDPRNRFTAADFWKRYNSGEFSK